VVRDLDQVVEGQLQQSASKPALVAKGEDAGREVDARREFDEPGEVPRQVQRVERPVRLIDHCPNRD